MNLADKNSKTPLMLAVGRKHDKVIAYLKKELKRRSSLLPRIDAWSVIFGLPGNTKGPLLFMLLSLIFWGYPIYVFKCIPTTWNELQMLHICFIAVNVLYWISLYAAATTDPGYLPRNVPAYDEAIKQVARYDEWRQEASVNPLSRLCHTCRAVKPLRTKHCRQCNRCVLTFDHHCPYIYNCIGINNRHWFLVFTGCVFIMCVLGDIFGIYMLHYISWDWFLATGLVVVAFFTVVSTVVFSCTLRQASVNLTTNERVNWPRYKYLQDDRGRYYNAYNQGWRRNFMEFFHLRRPLSEKDIEFLNVAVV